MAMDMKSNHIRNASILAYTYRGNWYGNQAYNVDFITKNVSGQGVSVFVSVAYTHYNTGYQANNISWNYVYGGSYMNQNTILNSTTGASGAFSFSCPTTTSFRVTKSAGSYGGLGFSNLIVYSMEKYQ